MFELPSSRNEFPCKNKRQNGPGLCDQMLYQSTTRKFASGKGMVLNAENGRGGLRDDPHVCPDRVGSKFHKVSKINMMQYRWHLQHMPCVTCGQKFNQEKCPLCPNCFKLICRNTKCGNQQTWIVKESMDQDSTLCNLCGSSTDPMKVFSAYDRQAREKETFNK